MSEINPMEERERLIAELDPTVSLKGHSKPPRPEHLAMVLGVAANLQGLLNKPQPNDEEPVDEL